MIRKSARRSPAVRRARSGSTPITASKRFAAHARKKSWSSSGTKRKVRTWKPPKIPCRRCKDDRIPEPHSQERTYRHQPVFSAFADAGELGRVGTVEKSL